MVMDVVQAYLAAIAVLGLFSYSSSAAVAVATAVVTHGIETEIATVVVDAREALATAVVDATNLLCKLPLCKVRTFLGADLF